MNQNYGTGQQGQYSSQQDPSLIDNVRYTGQSGGTQPAGMDGRGPAQESRYGATPLSTGTSTYQNQGNPVDTIRNPAAYGFKKDEPEGFRFPGTGGGVQQRTQADYQGAGGYNQQNMVDPNARGTQAGYGSSHPGYIENQGLQGSQTTGPNAYPANTGFNQQRNQSTPQAGDEFAKPQPGYGQSGFGAPTQGQNTTNLWPEPTPPAGAHRADQVGQGIGQQQFQQPGSYNNTESQRNQPKYGTDGAPWQAGGVQGYDSSSQGQKVGPYGSQPVDDTQGPYAGRNSERQDSNYNPNLNHPSAETGFGGGFGPQRTDTTYDASNEVASGYNNRTPTGADAYVTGNHPPGMQDRITGVNEPSMMGTGMGAAMGTSTMGEHRVEPGYDGSKGHLSSYNPQNPGRETTGQRIEDKVGVGHHVNTSSTYPQQGSTTSSTYPRETLGDKMKDNVGAGHPVHSATADYPQQKTMGTMAGTGYDETGGKTMEDTTASDDYNNKTSDYPVQDTSPTSYDNTDNYANQDTSTYGTGAQPQKKGLLTKIKEKIHPPS